MSRLFLDRKLIIATKHQKEKVVGPLLDRALGTQSVVTTDLDTDLFGTFSGERDRSDTALNTLRSKCLAGMDKLNGDLGFASEGSFGTHPDIPFVHVNEELVMLIDKKHNLELIGRHISTDTNFNGSKIYNLEEALAFSEKVGFPGHGLIVKSTKHATSTLAKGLTEKRKLIQVVENGLDIAESLWIETDMRACFNPTRVKAIRNATIDLIHKIESECPECSTPGFQIRSTQSGLPCSQCGFPTRSILSVTRACLGCGFEVSESAPSGKKFEDPTYCDYCNP